MVIRTKTILSIVVILVGVLGFIDSTRAQLREESTTHPASGGTTGTPAELAAAIVTPLTASCLSTTSPPLSLPVTPARARSLRARPRSRASPQTLDLSLC